MKKLHCIDVSGSMSNDQIDFAKKEMLKRFGRGDVVVVFDAKFEVVTDMDRDFRSYIPFGGGTWADPVLEYAKKIGAEPILYSDGYLDPKALAQFSEFVKIDYENT